MKDTVYTLGQTLDLPYERILSIKQKIKGTVRNFFKTASNFSIIHNEDQLKMQQFICLCKTYENYQDSESIPEKFNKSFKVLLQAPTSDRFKIPKGYENIKNTIESLLALETLSDEKLKEKQLKLDMCIFALLLCPRSTDMLDSKIINKLDDRLLFDLLIKKYTEQKRVQEKDLKLAIKEQNQWLFQYT